TSNNVLKLLGRFGFDVPFGREDLINELGITKSPASEILNKLRSIGAVLPARGSGRGKYRFDRSFFN
ncbi:MAG: cell filamentation protein, partial [Clostridia bacterium]|nr:cell filamentation protein [Clostridia bacterium]